MRIAVCKDGKTFGEPKIADTPLNFSDGISLFKKLAFELAAAGDIKAVAGGIKGALDRGKEKLVSAPVIIDWIGKPLKEELSKVYNVPIFIENDSALVGLGEAVYGAGKGYSIVAYITVSTGVGGVRIVNGKIDRSAMGFEPGHQLIDYNGPLCSYCKVPGHLEAYVSGSAFEERYGKIPYEITDEKIWDEAARFLAYGLNNTIVHWSPDVVVVGGSMMKEIGIPIERVRFHLKNILPFFPELPAIEKAALGDSGGLYGALALIDQQKI